MARLSATALPLDRLRGLVLLALVGLAAWLLVKIVLAWVAPSSVWEPVDVPRPNAPASPSLSTASYDFSTNPFSAGDAAEDAAPTVAEPNSDAPETTLNLVLTGIRATVGDSAGGSAQIRTPDGSEDRYYVGDTLQSGVSLTAIRADHVLLSVNGQAQRLATEDAKRAQTGRPAATRRAADTATIRAPDLQSLLGSAALIPALDRDGRRIGVRLDPRSAAIDLSDYGLRRGDVIVSVGGQRFDSGLPDVAALRRLAQGGRSVSAQIIRDGQPMTITIGGPS